MVRGQIFRSMQGERFCHDRFEISSRFKVSGAYLKMTVEWQIKLQNLVELEK
jgi:hypothetical protein